MSSKYVIDISIRRVDKPEPKPETGIRYPGNQTETVAAPTPTTIELTKIIQMASSLGDAKRVAMGLLELVTE